MKKVKTFTVLATPDSVEGVLYQKTEIEVEAFSWSEAYQYLRDNGYTPFVDEYVPSPFNK